MQELVLRIAFFSVSYVIYFLGILNGVKAIRKKKIKNVAGEVVTGQRAVIAGWARVIVFGIGAVIWTVMLLYVVMN